MWSLPCEASSLMLRFSTVVVGGIAFKGMSITVVKPPDAAACGQTLAVSLLYYWPVYIAPPPGRFRARCSKSFFSALRLRQKTPSSAGQAPDSRRFRSRILPILSCLARSGARARRRADQPYSRTKRSSKVSQPRSPFKVPGHRTHAGEDPAVSDVDPVLVCNSVGELGALQRASGVNPLHPPGRRIDFDRRRRTARRSRREHARAREVATRARHRRESQGSGEVVRTQRVLADKPSGAANLENFVFCSVAG